MSPAEAGPPSASRTLIGSGCATIGTSSASACSMERDCLRSFCELVEETADLAEVPDLTEPADREEVMLRFPMLDLGVRVGASVHSLHTSWSAQSQNVR